MAAPRKMLGRIDERAVVELMRLIETQSHVTLAGWACAAAREQALPVYKRAFPTDARPRAALDAAQAWISVGKQALPQLKATVREARAAAQEAAGSPAAQAAARAAATAAAVATTPTNALGMTFYLAAALAYDRLGLSASGEAYDAAASAVLADLLASLQEVAIADEPNPVKVDWGC